MGRSLAWRAATLGALALSACSSRAQQADALDPIDAGALSRVCEGDGSAEPGEGACWALGQLTTRTGCADTHCQSDGGLISRTPDYLSCGIAAPPSGSQAAPGMLAGADGALEADDDRCEFHSVVVPVCAGSSRAISFDAELFPMEGGAVPAGAAPYIEAFSGPTHLAPSTGTFTETAPGRYRIGPVVFDVPGRWTVTIHFFGTCRDDLFNSPHGHVTLTLRVP